MAIAAGVLNGLITIVFFCLSDAVGSHAGAPLSVVIAESLQ
jgi:hypothetical protein